MKSPVIKNRTMLDGGRRGGEGSVRIKVGQSKVECEVWGVGGVSA